MTNSERLPGPSADPLGETLHLLQLTGTLYCRAELTAPWGVEVPRLEGFIMFLVVTEGRCWLDHKGAKPRVLEQGSLTLIPHGTGYKIRSSASVKTRPLFDIPVEHVSERYERMQYGGGGARTCITSGVVKFDQVAAQRLISLLPQVLQINTWEDEAGSWLQSTLRFITREASALRPGGETVITRLADILVIQAIRSWLDTSPEAHRGWLAALRDEQMGRALAAIHREPGRAWSVASLAKAVGMSRSAFSLRFTALVGESAMRYLTLWRMQVARLQLQKTSEPIAVLSERLGYQSEAAFCRAFTRTFGVPPGSVRREHKRLSTEVPLRAA